jgi:hypothetical protein
MQAPGLGQPEVEHLDGTVFDIRRRESTLEAAVFSARGVRSA